MPTPLPLSYIELSRKNLEHNIASFRGVLRKGVKIAFAIKGNAYGHGQNEIAKMAEKHVDYFIVNSIEELRLLRQVSKKSAFVLGYVIPAMLPEALKLECILGVFSAEQFFHIQKAAKKLQMVQPVHIAVDALLGREGFLLRDLGAFFAAAKKAPNVKITGMYAHFANIEDTNNFTHAERQIAAYTEMREIARKAGYSDIETHISATSGVLAYEKAGGANLLVRIGIGAYGLWPSEHLAYAYKKNLSLKPVLSWKSHIAQIKVLPGGRTVGYGLTYMTKKTTRIGLVPQGYADGYARAFSNTGIMLVGGKRVPVIGRVSMNMLTVDLSKVPTVKEGDEVVIVGSQGKQSLGADELGAISGTINYEVTTRISPLLPRRIID